MLKNILLLVACIQIVLSQKFSQLRKNHEGRDLEANQIGYLAGLSDENNMDRLYEKIAIPRVVGTATHNKVHDFIVQELQELGFSVEIDTFEANTPTHGKLKFRNIIAKLNPNADRYLILSAHYDSKYFPNEVFIGATDSAVPCAMLLDLVRSMRAELNEVKTRNDVSLLLLFLDGEEAFQQWGPNDSIYGAKHLADKWHRSKSTARSGHRINDLDRIDAFVLLDLLGIPNPKFYSYFTDTQKLFLRMSDAEDRLKEQGLLKNQKQKYFPRMSSPSFVEDDHTPFYLRGVPILHIIPKEFPRVWHKLDDNMNAIDPTTVDNLNKIFRVFVAEYLHLPISVSQGGGNNRIGEDL